MAGYTFRRPLEGSRVVIEDGEIVVTWVEREEPKPEQRGYALPPMNSTDFSILRPEYVSFFNHMEIDPKWTEYVGLLGRRARANRARYEVVGSPLNIPWVWIAGTHLMESSFRFDRHLHNGDPLTRRTIRHPPGRPTTGSPPFTWEDSAADALRMKDLHRIPEWDLPRLLYEWERYNGWGYRSRDVATPYLWSFSSLYTRGKFVRDGVFDPNAVSAQCGAAVLLKWFALNGGW